MKILSWAETEGMGVEWVLAMGNATVIYCQGYCLSRPNTFLETLPSTCFISALTFYYHVWRGRCYVVVSSHGTWTPFGVVMYSLGINYILNYAGDAITLDCHWLNKRGIASWPELSFAKLLGLYKACFGLFIMFRYPHLLTTTCLSTTNSAVF